MSATGSGEHVSGRQAITFELAVHTRFMEITRRRQHTGTQLLSCWLEQAVLQARAGIPQPLDVPGRKIRGAGREWVKAMWKQSDEEYAEWARILASVGSSPTAVLRARVARYVELDGDRLQLAAESCAAA